MSVVLLFCSSKDELVGNTIADLIELNIPKFGLCNLTREVIENTNQNEEIDIDNSGLSFFSMVIPNAVPVTSLLLSKVSNKETERLILFDHLINDEDRHIGNILCTVSSVTKIFFIDCSHILTANNHSLNRAFDLEWELSPEKILDNHLLANKNSNLYDLLCNTVGYREDVLFSESKRIQSVVTKGELKNIQDSIPKEWLTDNSKKRVQDMFIILEKRVSLLNDITAMIAEERRSRQWKSY